MESLISETFNKALLDSGCTKTVCGEVWLEHFLQSLSYEEYKQVENFEGYNIFKFGDGNKIKSIKLVKFPVVIAETVATITTDVVKYNIPLLLSKEAMKKAKTQIDFQQDKIYIFGKKIDIQFTSTGHYCINLHTKFNESKNMKSNISYLCSYVLFM